MDGGRAGDLTLGGALNLWLEDRAREVRPQTLRVYRDTTRWLIPLVGAVRLEDAQRPARIRRILEEVELKRGCGAYSFARSALSGAFGVALAHGLCDGNPVRLLRRQSRVKASATSLPPEQVEIVRRCVPARAIRTERYVASSAFLLGCVMDVMLGSGVRINEALALRCMDVDWRHSTIAVTGTLVDTSSHRVLRQDLLKGSSQARVIHLPQFAIRALHDARQRVPDEGALTPVSPAIQGRVVGAWCHARNIRRSLRSLREDRELVAALALTGLVRSDLTPHVFRRTAATLVAVSSGEIGAAQRLLGHTDPRTTIRHYVGVAFRRVDSADALERLLGYGRIDDC